MFLRSHQLNVSSADDIPSEFDVLAFSSSNYAVVTAYETHISKQTVVLGGAKKLNVQLGIRPATGVFAHADFGVYPGGVGWGWIPNFDFQEFAQAKVDARQMLLLDVLHHGVVEFARKMNSDLTPFENAITYIARIIPLAEDRNK